MTAAAYMDILSGELRQAGRGADTLVELLQSSGTGSRPFYIIKVGGSEITLHYGTSNVESDDRLGWRLTFSNRGRMRERFVPGFKHGPDWGAIERILGERA